jgi:hypothetical protein
MSQKILQTQQILTMKILNLNSCLFSMFCALLFVFSTSHAQIYKWVDENGRTHYSEKKEDAGKSSPESVKVNSQPTTVKSPYSSPNYWQEQDRLLKQRQIEQQKSNRQVVVTRPQSLSGGQSDNTDQSKCNLARDVINGALRHTNGAPIDKHDRDVAQRDIEKYCH